MVATLMPLADWCSGGHRPNFPIINGLSQYSLPQGASQSARIGSRAAHHETACPYHCGKVQDFPSSGFSPHQSFTRSFFMCDSHRHHETTTTAAAPAGAGVTFHVSDMTCGHCAGVIRSALEESLPGGSEEHTSELQSQMRNSYDVFCLKKKKKTHPIKNSQIHILQPFLKNIYSNVIQ